MVDVFKEVDEELKNDEFSKWLRKYGVLILVFALLLIIATAVNSVYKNNKSKLNSAQTEILEDMLKMTSSEEIIKASKELDDSHRFLADFLVASKYTEAGEPQKAMDLYADIFNSKTLTKDYTDLARIYFVQNALNLEDTDLEEAKEILNPIIDNENDFYYVAMELNGIIAYKSGDKESAKTIFHNLSIDDNTPRSISVQSEKLETLYK